MRVYDPMGILSPFLIVGKMYLRQTWDIKVDWDEPLPSSLREKWTELFKNMFDINDLQYDRLLKPSDAEGLPTLVILSDESELAYGFSAYIRWQLKKWRLLVQAHFS